MPPWTPGPSLAQDTPPTCGPEPRAPATELHPWSQDAAPEAWPGPTSITASTRTAKEQRQCSGPQAPRVAQKYSAHTQRPTVTSSQMHGHPHTGVSRHLPAATCTEMITQRDTHVKHKCTALTDWLQQSSKKSPAPSRPSHPPRGECPHNTHPWSDCCGGIPSAASALPVQRERGASGPQGLPRSS